MTTHRRLAAILAADVVGYTSQGYPNKHAPLGAIVVVNAVIEYVPESSTRSCRSVGSC